MKTTLYLIRQAALAVTTERPRGRRQAEMTRDFLAVRAIDGCYCSPDADSVQTAKILAAPHGLTPQVRAYLRDADDATPLRLLGGSAEEAEFLRRQRRVTASLEKLLDNHVGQALLVVAHRTIHLGYLAGLLDITPDQALRVPLDCCGISVVMREGTQTHVATLNAAFHLQGLAA